MKKIAVLLLIVLLASLIACANTSDTPANKTSPTETYELSLTDIYPYPSHNFGGAEINFIALKSGYWGQDYEDITVEQMDGEVLNDAVYNRTSVVEDKYNVTIKVTYNSAAIDTVVKSILADDDEYQVIQDKLMYLQSNMATKNYLYDLTEVDSVTLEAPWYNQNIIKDLSLGKKVFVLGGDMTISDKAGVMVTVFNKKIAVDYDVEDLYQTVREGKWTLDKLHELAILTSKDLNGDGKMVNADDQWGLMAEDLAAWALLVGFGHRLADLDSDGIPYISVGGEKFLNDLDKVMDIIYNKNIRAAGSSENYMDNFLNNRNFIQVQAMSTIFSFRVMEEDFGIIPFPKFDEKQTAHISTLSPWVTRCFAMPTTNRDPEMVGAVIDAMSRESTETVMPAYYENVINNKIARDEESVEMLKLIYASVVYDLGSVYNWGNLWFFHQSFIAGGTREYVSKFAAVEDKIISEMEETIEAMMDYE